MVACAAALVALVGLHYPAVVHYNQFASVLACAARFSARCGRTYIFIVCLAFGLRGTLLTRGLFTLLALPVGPATFARAFARVPRIAATVLQAHGLLVTLGTISLLTGEAGTVAPATASYGAGAGCSELRAVGVRLLAETLVLLGTLLTAGATASRTLAPRFAPAAPGLLRATALRCVGKAFAAGGPCSSSLALRLGRALFAAGRGAWYAHGRVFTPTTPMQLCARTCVDCCSANTITFTFAGLIYSCRPIKDTGRHFRPSIERGGECALAL